MAPFLRLEYYPLGEEGPVKDFLDELEKKRPRALAKLFFDLKVLGTEGLQSPQIHVRSLGGGLWELKRPYEGVQYRILFGVHQGTVWLVYAFEKQSSKTPRDVLEVARRRLKEAVGS